MKSPILKKLKQSKILGPVGLAVVGFFLGGPITAVVLFFIWRAKWSTKTKTYVTIIFVAVFNAIQIIFAGQLIAFTYKTYSDLGKQLK